MENMYLIIPDFQIMHFGYFHYGRTCSKYIGNKQLNTVKIHNTSQKSPLRISAKID